ncbi:MAG: hypothetical protein HC906_06785 [Bacteroidales bacterium]|nr:hypothetical protein [Bacteroidales bacterium]
MASFTEEEIEKAKENAFTMSKTALWKSLIINYKQAYSKALSKVGERVDQHIKIEEKQN